MGIEAASKEVTATEPEILPEKFEPRVDLPDIPVEAGKGASAVCVCASGLSSLFKVYPNTMTHQRIPLKIRKRVLQSP